MGERVGIDCKLYRNTGTIATPVGVLVESVRDVKVPREWTTAEFKTRQRAKIRHRKVLLNESVTFQMEVNPSDVAETANFDAIHAAFLSQTSTVKLMMLDTLLATSGAQGLHETFQVTKCEVNQELEDAVLYDIECKLGLDDEDGEWLVVA
jgi:hypothetical protein